MRGSGQCITAAAYVAKHLAFDYRRAFHHADCIAVEVGIVVGVLAVRIELVQCDSTSLAEKEFDNAAIFNRQYRCAQRRHDVKRIMRRAACSSLGIGVLQLRCHDFLNGYDKRA